MKSISDRLNDLERVNNKIKVGMLCFITWPFAILVLLIVSYIFQGTGRTDVLLGMVAMSGAIIHLAILDGWRVEYCHIRDRIDRQLEIKFKEEID